MVDPWNRPRPGEDHLETADLSLEPGGPGSAATPLFGPSDVVAGRYVVVRFVAQGGMGEVYEAEDTQLHERVALKIVRVFDADQDHYVERFKREIQLARRVTHPNVCRIFDLGMHPYGGAELPFLTMELLAGENLEDRILRAGAIPLDEARSLAIQMADGLAAAHRAGVVHRDFKSANVILVPAADGMRAVVTDFGLARHEEAIGRQLTEVGKVVGTLTYMAPEQLEGKLVTPAADLYALGIVLFEMVTGRAPFTGQSALSAAIKRLKEAPPSPRVFRTELDPSWEQLILTLLARAPEERPASAGEVARKLRGEQVGPGKRTVEIASKAAAEAVRQERQRLRRLVTTAVVIAVAVLLAAILVARAVRADDASPRPSSSAPGAASARAPSST